MRRRVIQGIIVALIVWSTTMVWHQPVEGDPQGCDPGPGETVIGYGDVVTCSFGVPGESRVFRFPGSTGDEVVIQVWQSDCSDPCAKPDFTLYYGADTLIGQTSADNGSQIDYRLNDTGSYRIVVTDPANSSGDYTLALLTAEFEDKEDEGEKHDDDDDDDDHKKDDHDKSH